MTGSEQEEADEVAGPAEVKRTNQELLDAVARLVDELADVPAGVVLGSFSRAVRATRQAGYSLPELPTEAERLARRLIAARPGLLPRQRTASGGDAASTDVSGPEARAWRYATALDAARSLGRRLPRG